MSLTGKHAVVGGISGAYADVVAARLRAEGARVTGGTGNVPDLTDADIVVVCPPPSVFKPGNDADVLLVAVDHAQRWTEAAATAMAARGTGVIVHLTGLPGMGGWRGWHTAGTVFSAVHSLVKTHALDLAAKGVRINALVTGVTSDLAATIAASSGLTQDDVRARIPAGRFLSPDDIGNALVYLVHDSSSYVTGETLVVDGGWDSWGRLHAAAAS